MIDFSCMYNIIFMKNKIEFKILCTTLLIYTRVYTYRFLYNTCRYVISPITLRILFLDRYVNIIIYINKMIRYT